MLYTNERNTVEATKTKGERPVFLKNILGVHF